MKYLIILALAFTFIFPDITLAQTPLVPCDGSPTDPCNICHFVDLSNNIIVWLIGVLMVVFAVMAVVAGFGLVTSGGNPSAKEAAKSKFTNAVIGLVVVLAGWLIVDTVMRTLLSGGEGEFQMTGFGPWAQIECVAQPTVSQAPPPAAPTTPVTPGAPSTPVTPGAPSTPVTPGAPSTPTPPAGDEAAVRSQLSEANIPINNQPCPVGSNGQGCTNVAGLRSLTVQRVVELRNQVGGNVVITGGTEPGHTSGTYSHTNGYKVDLRTTTELNNYITTNYTSLGNNRWSDPNGNIYYRHGPVDHWDVLIRY